MDVFHPNGAHYLPHQSFPDLSHLNAPDYPHHLAHPLFPQLLCQPVHDDMPRPSFFSYSPDVIKHRKRTSRAQRKVLEDAFRNNPKPSQYTRKLLIHQTGMERRAIQVWFQNRRAKEKKLAAKANQAAGATTDPAAKVEPRTGDESDAEDDDDDDDQNPTEGAGSPATASPDCSDVKREDDLVPSATASVSQVVSASSSALAGATSDESIDQQATPSPLNASTPAATTSGSSSSPMPSTNGAPSPPSIWRSHESTPALGAKAHLVDPEYAVRRESAPAPLGANFPRPSPFPPFVQDNTTFRSQHLQAGNNNVAIWEGSGTPPSPLSINEDIINLRRGSLPVFSTHGNSVNGMGVPSPQTQLTGLTPDPNHRRMSLERSRQRLASHPYAHRVMTNRNIPGQTVPYNSGFTDSNSNHRPAFLHSATAPQLQPAAQMSLEANQQPTINWDTGVTDSSFPSYVRPRRYGSCQIGMETAPYRTRAEIVPGPLPAPGFSFGTAPTAINETDGDDDETNTGTSLSMDDVHRFGSFASVASTTSSSTSAWYSDAPPSNGIASSDELPATWNPDHRRASCPAPSFMYAFSGLQVSNEVAASLDKPVFNSSELALALDLSKTAPAHRDGTEPIISVEDPSPVAHETQMQAKMQGPAVTGYPDNVSYYPDPSFAAPAPTTSGYVDPFAYSTLAGYEVNSPCADTTPTASNGSGVPYQYHQ